MLGKKITNGLINSTAGKIFTSGETTQSLNLDIKALGKRNIGGVANYVVEGLDTIDEKRIDLIQAYMEQSLEDITGEGQLGNFALKLSALLSIEAMSELSRTQTKFSELLLKSRGGTGKVEAGLLKATLKQELGLEVGGGECEELVQLLGEGLSSKSGPRATCSSCRNSTD